MIQAADHPAAGTRRTVYDITGFDAANHPALQGTEGECGIARLTVVIQDSDAGPSDQRGGVSMESLLAICGDRMRGLQIGDYACAERGLALDNLEAALRSLHARTARLPH